MKLARRWQSTTHCVVKTCRSQAVLYLKFVAVIDNQTLEDEHVFPLHTTILEVKDWLMERRHLDQVCSHLALSCHP